MLLDGKIFSFISLVNFSNNNWLIDNIYSSNVNINNNFFTNFFYFFFSFKYNTVENYYVKFFYMLKLFIIIWNERIINLIYISYNLDLFLKLNFFFFSNFYYLFSFSLELPHILKELDLIFFYKNLYKIYIFNYYTYNIISFENISYFYKYDPFFNKFLSIFFNYYVFLLFIIIAIFEFPLNGKNKIYSFIQLYTDFLLLIPNLIEVSLEDILFIFNLFKIILIYFLISLFFLNKPASLNFNYLTLPFIFVMFGSVLCFVFSKHLINLFVFGPSVYTGISFSKFSQSILFGIIWDYVLVVLMFFRFGVILARLILVWMSFILVEIMAYFLMEPTLEELFQRINFLWKNQYIFNNYLYSFPSFDSYGEVYLLFFITCFFYFCKLLLVSLQLVLFLLFGFFLTSMFTGYLDNETYTNYFKEKYILQEPSSVSYV